MNISLSDLLAVFWRPLTSVQAEFTGWCSSDEHKSLSWIYSNNKPVRSSRYTWEALSDYVRRKVVKISNRRQLVFFIVVWVFTFAVLMIIMTKIKSF